MTSAVVVIIIKLFREQSFVIINSIQVGVVKYCFVGEEEFFNGSTLVSLFSF